MNFKQTSPGVTFIEVMTATVIISIACIGLLMGVVHARSELHSLQIKERATEELLNYMEYWKGRVADGNITQVERAGDPNGDQVYLVGALGEKNSIRAKLYYDLDRLDRFNDFGATDFTRYELKCWIRWDDRFITSPGSYAGNVVQERKLSTIMTVFEI